MKSTSRAAPSITESLKQKIKARMAEVAKRYAWDDRAKKVRRKPNLIVKVRLREMERLFSYRWGAYLPDDDAGRDDLLVVAHHLHQMGNLDTHLAAWARLWAPWLGDNECTAIVERVLSKPLRWTADTLAWRLGLKMTTRTALQITTIGATDCNKQERAEARKERDAAAKRTRRAQTGAVARSEYVAASAAKAKPWDRLGMKRASWYAKGKPQPPEPIQTEIGQVRLQQSVASIAVDELVQPSSRQVRRAMVEENSAATASPNTDASVAVVDVPRSKTERSRSDRPSRVSAGSEGSYPGSSTRIMTNELFRQIFPNRFPAANPLATEPLNPIVSTHRGRG